MAPNPFSTHCWSAGTLPFLCSEDNESVASLLKKSLQLPVCQIVGTHGSGKSTLLLELLKQYKSRSKGVRFDYLFFNDQHRQIPHDLTFQANQIFFVDGVEQLSFWNRFWLLSRMRRVIFTVHDPVWFVPVLYQTQPQFSIFVRLVRRLSPDFLEEPMLRQIYDRSAGNFRRAFFELYDYWENNPPM